MFEAGGVSSCDEQPLSPPGSRVKKSKRRSRQIADLLSPIYDCTNGEDGWVSQELSPQLAHKCPAGTCAASRCGLTMTSVGEKASKVRSILNSKYEDRCLRLKGMYLPVSALRGRLPNRLHRLIRRNRC
jgi:hypothetical protein